MSLTGDQRAALAAAIADRRARTLARRARLDRDVATLEEATRDSPDDEHDPEGATIGFERAQAGTLRDEAAAQLAALDRAAADLAAGRLGTCETCGDAIAVERLLARPTTRHCVRCAT